MKPSLAIFICMVSVACASVVSEDSEVFLDERQEESERSCINLGKECTSDHDGCCAGEGYSEVSCQCYILKKDIKRYNTEGKAHTKCWCERTGHWWEKLGDWVADKTG